MDLENEAVLPPLLYELLPYLCIALSLVVLYAARSVTEISLAALLCALGAYNLWMRHSYRRSQRLHEARMAARAAQIRSQKAKQI